MNRILLFLIMMQCSISTIGQSLKEKAESGDMNAQYQYARSLSNVSFDEAQKQAFAWFLKAAEQGHSGAQNSVGYRYYYGKGVAQDYNKAFYWYNEAANRGEATAIYNVAICYENGRGVTKSPSRAFESYKKSADLGYEPGKLALAGCYNGGTGTSLDYSKAFQLYSELADRDNTKAQYELALMYLKGNGVEKDSIFASDLLLSAAGGGISPHQIFRYDEKEANKQARTKLISLASLKDSQYHYYIAAILGCLYEAEANFTKAEEAYKKSIAAGGKLGVLKLGLMYFYNVANDTTQNYYMDDYTESNGLGLECWKYNEREGTGLKEYLEKKSWTDTDNAVYWLEKAVEYETGNFKFGAMPYSIYTHLLFCYNDGIGGFKNIEKAIETAYRQISDEDGGYDYEFSEAVLSANLENTAYSIKVFNIYKQLYDMVKKPQAKHSSFVLRIATAGLGKAFYKGLGVSTDYANAFKYLSIASDMNDSESMRLLAACYRYGRGTQRNAVKEKEWFDKAVKMRDDRAVELYNRLVGKSL